jgi:hypothetical protein
MGTADAAGVFSCSGSIPSSAGASGNHKIKG